MRGKLGEWVLLFFCVLPFLIALVGIQFLPDQIPTHYNAANEIDGWGSKYQELVLAAAFSVGGWIIWLVAKFGMKFADTEEEYRKALQNRKVLIYIGIGTMVFLCALQTVLMVGSGMDAASGAETSVMPIWKIVGVGTGVFCIFLGLIMPKAQPNGLMGVRTPWSFASAEAWHKSQKAGGLAMAVAGALCAVLSLIFSGFAIFWVIMVTILGGSVVACVLSFKFSRE